MAVCEFANPSLDGRQPACRTLVALKQIIDVNDLGGVFTPVNLKKEICDNPDPTAREQCPAYADLQRFGRSSSYCK